MIKIAAIIVLTAFIFVYDLIAPHGMSVSLLYLIPFSLSGMLTGEKFAFAFAGVTTALVIAGYFLAAAPNFPVVSEINRSLTVMVGWGILVGLIQRKRVLSELSKANARLKAIFDSSPNGMVALDSDGKVLAWNQGAQKIFGYEPQEVIGRLYPLVDGNADDLKKLMATYREGNPMMTEVIRKRKDGTRIQTLLSTAPLKDAEGQVIGVLGILMDLTEKKRAEAEIEKANAMLKAIFECAPVAIIAIDLDGNVLDWNRGAQKIFGYEPQEVIGRFYPLVDGDADGFKKLLAEYREGKSIVGIEVARKRKDGKMIQMLLSSAPLKDAGGQVIGVMGILMDLTEMKRAEVEIEKANEMLKAVFDCAPVAIIAMDPEANVLEWNRGATDIFGYEASEVIGRPYPIVAKEDFDTLKKNLDTLFGGKPIYNMELPRRRKDGKIIQALGSGAPLRDAKGHVVGTLVTFFDLTEKKKAAADIERLNIEVAERAMVEREREDLSAMIIHDLKSPLTAMMAYTDMLIENRIEDKKEALRMIRMGSEKILGMVEDYLTVYRSHAVKLELQMMPEEIVNILRGFEKDFHALAEKKYIRLNFAFADSPKAVIDKKQFSRAVSNLVENAIKFTPKRGSITLSVEASESDFTVSVSDTGPGILPGEQDGIFQKHYRSSMAMGTTGAGLGLAIVKAIAEAHGGKITFENNPGSGSTFKLTIPLRQESAE